MNSRKTFLIIFFIITLSIFLFPIQKEYFIKDEIPNYKFNNKFIPFNKTKLLFIPTNLEKSYINQYKTTSSYIFFRESIENIINKKNSNPDSDLIIVFTFINSIYYLIKFKINLWIYNKSILFENSNKFKPYFNINYKNKLISFGFNIDL